MYDLNIRNPGILKLTSNPLTRYFLVIKRVYLHPHETLSIKWGLLKMTAITLDEISGKIQELMDSGEGDLEQITIYFNDSQKRKFTLQI